MADPLAYFRSLSYSTGELARLRSFCRANGTTLILPYDQFVEHDCRHLEAESDAGNPHYIMKLAVEGGYNGVAVHYGVAKRAWSRLEGKVPLVLKVNGKTSIPPDKKALSTLTSFVEDGVRIGASAIGYTLYYGSPRQDEDIPQLATVRRACDRFGLPLIVWAYPRGEAVEAKGGRDTSYMVESATRMAVEMGASVVKANLPKAAGDTFQDLNVPAYYKKLEKDLAGLSEDEATQERANRVVQAAQGVPILFSGGSKIGDDDLLKKAEMGVKAGCWGFIFGRNMWKREEHSALEITRKVQALLDQGAPKVVR